jgi:hypothetical protein
MALVALAAMRTSLLAVIALLHACAHVAPFEAGPGDRITSCRSPDTCTSAEGTADDTLTLSLAGAGLVGLSLYYLVPLLRPHSGRSL